MNLKMLLLSLVFLVSCNNEIFDNEVKGHLLNSYLFSKYRVENKKIDESDYKQCLEPLKSLVNFKLKEKKVLGNGDTVLEGEIVFSDVLIMDYTLKMAKKAQKNAGVYKSGCPTDFIKNELKSVKEKYNGKYEVRARKDNFKITLKTIDGEKIAKSVRFDSIKDRKRNNETGFNVNLKSFK